MSDPFKVYKERVYGGWNEPCLVTWRQIPNGAWCEDINGGMYMRNGWHKDNPDTGIVKTISEFNEPDLAIASSRVLPYWYEDRLPHWFTDEVYSQQFQRSRIVCGVRMFPAIPSPHGESTDAAM
jgi:hypothetical protein